MKKLLLLLSLATALLSCKTTALVVPSVDKSAIVKPQSNMEFIGCKNISRSNFMLKGIGEELEHRKIASNASQSYRGIYSEYELATYTSRQRYVTYLEVAEHSYTQNDEVHDNGDLYVAGLVIGGLTLYTLVPVYVPMLCASKKDECEIRLTAEYTIVVFDSETKQNVFVKPVSLQLADLYKGQYGHKNTNQTEVNIHYKTLLYNAIIEVYSEAWNYVNTLPY